MAGYPPQYPPQQQGQYPQQQGYAPQQPAAAPPTPPPVPGGAYGGAPAAGEPSELSKLGFFGLLTFVAVAACIALALLGWILTLAKTIHGGNFYQFAGYFGQAGLVLLGLTIVARVLDRK
ncbi:MAG: hypothetical protein JXB32_12915 [Deltaproteobacteria bacterium]|nr:hypothetical protein [Deltaproteobacteria bacterium]